MLDSESIRVALALLIAWGSLLIVQRLAQEPSDKEGGPKGGRRPR